MAIEVIEGGRPDGTDLVLNEAPLPIGAMMIGAVAAGCKAAEAEFESGSDVRIVCVAYDPETGSINLASSHDKESTSNTLMIAVQRYAGMEMRLPRGEAKKAAARRKSRKEADSLESARALVRKADNG